jgi:hypothetical protein
VSGQSGDGRGEGVGDHLGAVPIGQADEHQVARGTLDQGGDRGHALAEQQVAFPVTGHRPVGRLGRPL